MLCFALLYCALPRLSYLIVFCGLFVSLVINATEFTATQFKSAFQTLGKCISPSVLYPVVEFESEANIEYARAHQAELMPYLASADIHTHIFVSLNRYERKKSVSLALLALRDLREQLEVSSSSASNSNNNSNSNSDQSPLKLLLVVAGGYDVRVEENVQYLQELQRLAADCQFNILTSDDAAGSSLPTGLKLTGNTNSSTSGSRGRIQCDIVFRTSISLLERVALLLRATGEVTVITVDAQYTMYMLVYIYIYRRFHPHLYACLFLNFCPYILSHIISYCSAVVHSP